MPELYGPLQHVSIASWLWLIPLFPLLAAIYCAAFPWWIRRENPDKKATSGIIEHRTGLVATIGVALAFAASVAHFAILVSKPEDERYLLQHLWRMVRVGQLDASFDLALDPLASTMTLVVTGIGALIFVFAAKYLETEKSHSRFFAWMSLFVFAMLVLVLADNLVLMFFGWEGVGLCSWGLIGFWWGDSRKATAGLKAFIVNRIGDAGFLVGIAALFWGLGGTFSDEDYTPDLNARFSSVAVTAIAPEAAETDRDRPGDHDMPPTTGKGLLTMTSYSGAVVFMDDARTPLMRSPGEPLRAPFTKFAINGGIHSFRIHPGSGLDDYLVSHVAMGEGREIALTAFGPTVTFRHIRDQLVSKDPKGQSAMKDAFIAKRGWGRLSIITVACLLLFIGAVGKSAQIPLFVWLPDAMAGPTPVSALIHAATMVTAGVYMIVRLDFLFALSHAACTVVACIGALTALLAATMGFYQYDLKKILAYSTISQLGFMMIGVGVGAYSAGVFHLVTHACFKACLFLAAGSVIHGMHAIVHDGGLLDERASQDIRNMGGLKKRMPKTARAYFFACLAITAAPIPGLAGFWSKDDILAAAFASEALLFVPGSVIGGAGLLAGMFTSFYMWRSYFVVFEGNPKGRADTGKVHESSPRLTSVLLVLAYLSAGIGIVLGVSAKLFGGYGGSLLERWLEPNTRDAFIPTAKSSLAVTWGVIAAAYGLAFAGYAFAKARYATRTDWEARERRAPGYALFANAYYIDALYTHTIVRFVYALRDLAISIDTYVIDGLVNGAAIFTRAAAWLTGRIDDDVVDGAIDLLATTTLKSGDKLRAVQSGRIQTYVYVLVAGVLAVAFFQYWLR